MYKSSFQLGNRSVVRNRKFELQAWDGKVPAGGGDYTLRCATYPAFPPLKGRSTHRPCYPQPLGWCLPGSVEGMKTLILTALWEPCWIWEILKCSSVGVLVMHQVL